ncbi:hypothetical protein BJX64DRAFT_292622 [Aspergillus heterothallicus]
MSSNDKQNVPMDKSSQSETHQLLAMDPASLSKGATIEDSEIMEPKQSRLHKWRTGWKFTLFLSSLACVLVLSFNTGLLLWAVVRDRVQDAKGTLTTGKCDRVSRLNTGLHLLINVFSTILLAASNHGMQCLSAPTRGDIDRVHRYGGWLNIGVSSIKNLGYVSGRRFLMWLCLLLSSVPLHLLYNSTVFYTTSAYGYDVFVGPRPLEGRLRAALDADDNDIPFDRLYQAAQNAKYGRVIILSDDMPSTTFYDWVAAEDVYTPIQGMVPHVCTCSILGLCSASDAARGEWKVSVHTVKSCQAERVPQHFRLQYSLPLTIAVIVANLIKAVVLCYMSFSRSDPPLLTTGDAVASFLHRPDCFTLGKCLLSARGARNLMYSREKHLYKPLSFEGKRTRCYSTIAKREWLPVLFFWTLALGLCIGLLFYAQSSDGEEIWTAQFGKTSSVSANNVIKGSNWPASLISSTIIANIPQPIFSLLYFCTHGILSAIALASEWSRYSLPKYHRGLRVSWNPQGAQRPSYFLSLPYRCAVPLIAASAMLHWLISHMTRTGTALSAWTL